MISHRHLKPVNILGKVVDDKIIWKLRDFGLSTRENYGNNEVSMASSPVGTINYRSPDVVQSFHSAVYSLGLVFCKVFDILFWGEKRELIKKIEERKLSHSANFCPVFEVVVEMLSLEPGQRPSAMSIYDRLLPLDPTYVSPTVRYIRHFRPKCELMMDSLYF